MTPKTAPRLFGLPLGVRNLDLADPAIALSVRLFRWQEDATYHRLRLRHDDLRAFLQWSRLAKRRGVLGWGMA
jgi:hypothetical protein